ncbi:putative nucleotidyltransferase [Nitrosospira multiformis]|uniref:Putative nucleotidyltransferase n=1 Tax=Nitrosospira multiformis TaxID=1231 RepID=A0A2T5I6X7_9PROT|nr:nucleotidyl transferase AbiEii/AbiGii toxin family protein [Nitrosospira multiformis]PTQ79591.1 putative nucleotidyltransferase [Nitrosospira multiformis]
MIDTSPPLTLKPNLPVDSTTVLAIRQIHEASKALGFPVFLVGAMARIILLENIYGLQAGRATTDVDFAFALDNWEQFEAVKEFLVSNANFEESTNVPHRLLLQLPSLSCKLSVDLIPFGGIERSLNVMAWPPDMSVIMNVAGYSDALATAVKVEVSPGIDMAIASLPGIVILKLFAWEDRGQETRKDATDLAILFRSYHEAGNESRIYEESTFAALVAVEYDIELAGAWLLGKDVAVMASAQTNRDLKELLTGKKSGQLIEDMARTMLAKEDALEHSRRLFEQFTTGFITGKVKSSQTD